MVSLLFLTAIAALGITLGEDFGPNSNSGTEKNPGVYYVNPVLFAVTWVSIGGFTFIQLPPIEVNTDGHLTCIFSVLSRDLS